MPWFMTGRDSSGGWHFDVVGLLAVIGEDIIIDQAQLITSSKLSLLPRLIPAPQGLLRAERPRRLPGVPGVIVKSVYGGTQVDELNYFANVTLPVENLPKHYFKVVRIEQSQIASRQNKSNTDIEMRPRAGSINGGASLPAHPAAQSPVVMRSRPYSPLNLLAILSCLGTIALFIIAWICFQDGVAAVAIFLLALQSSLGCGARCWNPHLVQRLQNASPHVPPGDVCIRTRNGAFVIVKCDDNVARQLFIGVDEAKYYVSEMWSRPMTGLVTAFLMIGVILLGNSGWYMQLIVGGSFVLLNAAYWIVSILPKDSLWLWQEQYEIITKDHEGQDYENEPKPSFTLCLWAAIRHTKQIRWIKDTRASPQTDAWDSWLLEALDQVQRNPDVLVAEAGWDARGRMEALTRWQGVQQNPLPVVYQPLAQNS